MTLDEIKTLIEAMGASDLAEMELAKDGWTLKLVRDAARPAAPTQPAPPLPDAPARPPASARPPAAAPKRVAASPDLRAPLAGIAYLSSSPDAPPFVAPGQQVQAGAILCTIEAMKTFNEVRADRAGTVEAILVATGDEVEAGQPLFRIG